MKLFVDRREGDFWVCISESGETADIPVSLLKDCNEGDWITIKKDASSKRKYKKIVDEKIRKLFK